MIRRRYPVAALQPVGSLAVTDGGGPSPHGTTIVASTFDGGVVMAGDRRATISNIIAQRDIEKVYPADEYSLIGIAGTAGLAMEVVQCSSWNSSITRRSRACRCRCWARRTG